MFLNQLKAKKQRYFDHNPIDLAYIKAMFPYKAPKNKNKTCCTSNDHMYKRPEATQHIIMSCVGVQVFFCWNLHAKVLN